MQHPYFRQEFNVTITSIVFYELRDIGEKGTNTETEYVQVPVNILVEIIILFLKKGYPTGSSKACWNQKGS